MPAWPGQTIFFVENAPEGHQERLCVLAEPIPVMPKGKWLMDTGCAYDLISNQFAKDGPIRPAEDKSCFCDREWQNQGQEHSPTNV